MEVKAATIFDPGTASPLEDKTTVAAPFYAVFDGVSGAYHPSHGWRDFDGRSGGQVVVDIADEVIRAASAAASAQDVLKEINVRVHAFVESQALTEPKDIPGTAFAMAKVTDSGVEVVQCGDAFAVWELQDGSVGATPNQNYANEERLLGMVRTIAAKYQGDKQALWHEYLPVLAEAKKNTNRPGGHVVLNGDKACEALWFKKTFAAGTIKTLLLITDGATTFEETQDGAALARLIVDTYKQGGVDGLLARVRQVSEAQTAQHIKHAEVTALAIEFT